MKDEEISKDEEAMERDDTGCQTDEFMENLWSPLGDINALEETMPRALSPPYSRRGVKCL